MASSESDGAITPAALAAFAAMRELEQRCTCPPRDWGGKYWEHPPPCAACEEWWRRHNILHRELGCRPWEWPCVRNPDAKNPYPAGSFAAERWEEAREDLAQARWRALERVLRQRAPA
jgi:hypothetical protein